MSGEKTGLQLGMWSGFSWHSTMTQRMMDASHEQDCWHGLGTGTSAPSAYVTLFNKQLPSPGMALVPDDEGVVNESSSPVVVVVSAGGASVSSVEAAVCGTVWWLDGAPVVADESPPPSTGEEVWSSTMVVGESDDVLPIITSKSLESVTSGACVSSASGAPVTLLEDSVLDGPWLSVDWLSVEDALIGALPSVDESGSTSVTLTASSGRSVGLSLSSALTEASVTATESVTAAESVADGIPWAESVEVSALVSGASVSIADSDAGVVDEGGVLPCAAAASVEDSASVGEASELVGVVAAGSDASATDESVGSCESTDETVVDGSWMKSVAAVAVVVDE